MQQDDADIQVEVCSALLNNKRELGEISKEIGVRAKNTDNERLLCDLIKDSYYHCCPLSRSG